MYRQLKKKKSNSYIIQSKMGKQSELNGHVIRNTNGQWMCGENMQHLYPLRKCKSKLPWDSISILVRLIIKNTKNNKCWQEQGKDLSILLVGRQISTATVEISTEVPLKSKDRTTMWSRDATLWCIPKAVKASTLQGKLHTWLLQGNS